MINATDWERGTIKPMEPADVVKAVTEACVHVVWADKVARFEHEDGSPVEFDITVRIRNPVPSPESTREYPPCPECGEDREYRGFDDRSVASQTFTVRPGVPTYDDLKASIDSYTEIRCGHPRCNALIWSEYLA